MEVELLNFEGVERFGVKKKKKNGLLIRFIKMNPRILLIYYISIFWSFPLKTKDQSIHFSNLYRLGKIVTHFSNCLTFKLLRRV